MAIYAGDVIPGAVILPNEGSLFAYQVKRSVLVNDGSGESKYWILQHGWIENNKFSTEDDGEDMYIYSLKAITQFHSIWTPSEPAFKDGDILEDESGVKYLYREATEPDGRKVTKVWRLAEDKMLKWDSISHWENEHGKLVLTKIGSPFGADATSDNLI